MKSIVPPFDDLPRLIARELGVEAQLQPFERRRPGVRLFIDRAAGTVMFDGIRVANIARRSDRATPSRVNVIVVISTPLRADWTCSAPSLDRVALALDDLRPATRLRRTVLQTLDLASATQAATPVAGRAALLPVLARVAIHRFERMHREHRGKLDPSLVEAAIRVGSIVEGGDPRQKKWLVVRAAAEPPETMSCKDSTYRFEWRAARDWPGRAEDLEAFDRFVERAVPRADTRSPVPR